MKNVHRHLMYAATAVLLSVPAASAAAKHDTPIAPPTAQSAPACDLAQHAGLEGIIGKNAKFIPMFNNTEKGVSASMCAYASADEKLHYGLLLRKSTYLPKGRDARAQADAAIAKMKQGAPASQISQPKIGDAALWNAKAHMLMVWSDGGKTSLVFIGDKTTPNEATHMAIAKKILATLQK